MYPFRSYYATQHLIVCALYFTRIIDLDSSKKSTGHLLPFW